MKPRTVHVLLGVVAAAVLAWSMPAGAADGEERARGKLLVRQDFEAGGANVVAEKGLNGSKGLVGTKGYGFHAIQAKGKLGLATVRLSFWAASPDGGSTNSWVQQFDSKGRKIAGDHVRGTNVRLGPEFKHVEASFGPLFADTRSVRFYFYRHGNKTVILDDIEVRLVGRDALPRIAPTDAVELVQNGDFEQGLDPVTKQPRHWSWKRGQVMPGGSYSFKLTDESRFVHSGKYALYLTGKQAHLYFNYPRVFFTGGAEYLLRFWVKGNGHLRGTGMGGNGRALNNAWTEVRVPVRPEKKGRGLSFWLYMAAEAWCAIDDVSLTVDGVKYPAALTAGTPEPRKLSGPEYPHIPWARPLAGQPPKVLFVIQQRYARQVLDLAERLELADFDVVTGARKQGVAGYGDYLEDGPQDLLEHLLKKNRYDVVVITSAPPHQVRTSLQKLLLERVEKDGMGVIWTQPYLLKDRRFFAKEGRGHPALVWDAGAKQARSLSFETIHERGALKVVRTNTVGKGRIMLTGNTYWGLITQDIGHIRWGHCPHYWEYWYATWARAILWAAGHTPAVALEKLSVQNGVLQAALKPSEGEPAPKGVRLEVTWRDFESNELQKGTVPVELEATPGAIEVPVPEQLTLARPHVAEVRLLTGQGRVLDFGSTSFTPASPARIAKVEVDKLLYEPDDKAVVNITVAAAEGQTPSGTWSLQLETRDSWGRLVHRETMAIPSARKETSIQATIPIRSPISGVWEVSATLLQRAVARDRAYGQVVIRQPREIDDVFVGRVAGWKYWQPDFYIERYAKILRGYGFRAAMGMGALGNPRPVRLNVRDTTMNAAVARNKERAGNTIGSCGADGVRKWCLHDPANEEFLLKDLKRNMDWVRRWSCIVYGIADEPGLLYAGDDRDTCFSPQTLAAFRKHLQRVHGAIGKLNAQWETNFASWDAVRPMKTAEVKDRKNVGPWLDFRIWMASQFARAFGQWHDMVRKLDGDPGVLCGANIHHQTPYTGTNAYDFARYLSLCQTYPRHFEWNRSFVFPAGSKKNRAGLLMWTGYSWGTKRYHYDPWRVAVWGGAMPFYFFGLTEDLYDQSTGWGRGFFSAGGAPTDALTDSAEAIKDLVGGVGKLLVNTDIPQPPVAVLVTYEDLYDAYRRGRHMQHEMDLLAQKVHAAGLTFNYVVPEQVRKGHLKHYRALVVAKCSFLDEKALGAIADYQKKANPVFVIGALGGCDQHGKPRKDLAARDSIVTASTKANAGKSLEQWLAALPVERPAEMVTPQSAKRPNVLVVPHVRGPLKLAALLRHYSDGADAPPQTTWKLPDKLPTYEVRTRRYFGVTDTVKIDLPVARAAVLAQLPYQIGGVMLSSVLRPPQGHAGVTITVVSSDGKVAPADHVVRIEVSDPSGKLREEYGKNFLVRKGETKYFFPLALDEPRKGWKIKVTEIISGKTATKSL